MHRKAQWARVVEAVLVIWWEAAVNRRFLLPFFAEEEDEVAGMEEGGTPVSDKRSGGFFRRSWAKWTAILQASAL